MIFKTLNDDNINENSFKIIPGNEEKKELYFAKININLHELDNKIDEALHDKNYEKFALYMDLKMKYENEFVTL